MTFVRYPHGLARATGGVLVDRAVCRRGASSPRRRSASCTRRRSVAGAPGQGSVHGRPRPPTAPHLAVSVAGPTTAPPSCWPTAGRGCARSGPRSPTVVDDGHRVVVYDQRGHGESTLGDTEPSIPNLGDDLRLVLDAVDARRRRPRRSLDGRHDDPVLRRRAPRRLPSAGQRRRAGGHGGAAPLGRALPPDRVDALPRRRTGGVDPPGRVGRRMVRGAIGERPQRSAHRPHPARGSPLPPGQARAGFLVAMAAMDLRRGGRRRSARCPPGSWSGPATRSRRSASARQLAAGIPGAELEVIPGRRAHAPARGAPIASWPPSERWPRTRGGDGRLAVSGRRAAGGGEARRPAPWSSWSTSSSRSGRPVSRHDSTDARMKPKVPAATTWTRSGSASGKSTLGELLEASLQGADERVVEQALVARADAPQDEP